MIPNNGPILLSFFKRIVNKDDSVDEKTLTAVEQILEDAIFLQEQEQEDSKSNFCGMFIVKMYPEGDMKLTYKNKNITEEDKDKLGDWILQEDHTRYVLDHYRIDFENYIFIFKTYQFNKNLLLIGHLLKNNLSSKADLLNLRQESLLNEM